MSFHRFLDFENGMSCIVCGGFWNRERENDMAHCSGRRDYVHGYDCSAHSLDDCAAFDETGECEHLASLAGCDCDLCRA